MAKRRRRKKYVETFEYKCSITEEKYLLTEKAQNPEELISVAAFYDLNPDKDDRPDHVKAELGVLDKKEQ